MVPPPDNVRRHFLPWDQPLLPLAVRFLAAGWNGATPLDLSGIAVVVPTRQSGRRLREAIAGHAAERGQAAFPPRVLTPDRLAAVDHAAGVASRLESLLAWAAVFREIDLEAFRRVLPVDPPARSFSWAFRLAQEFARLQASLAETGLRLGDVPGKAGDDFAEAERWRQIAELEGRHAEKLSVFGLRDAQAAKIERARAPSLPGKIRRIVVLAAPDPLPLALEALAALARTVPVDVVVFAPATEAAGFDGWGRALAATWATRSLDLPEFERRVHLCADPAAQAARLVATAREYAEPEGLLGVGAADPEILPPLETGLRQAGIANFNPEGRPRHGDGLFQLLGALARLARDESFRAVEALARCPDFLEHLVRSRPGFSAADFLARLDRLHTEHLPPDLAEARRHGEAPGELAVAAELRATLAAGSFPVNAAAALGVIFAGRRFDLVRPEDALAAAAAEAWAEVMRETASAAARFGEVTTAEWWEVALRLYGETVRTDEKPAGALELQGWLELLWEDAPHLVVAGLNDGSVPDAVVGDPFLPESLREKLGLKTNAARFARDAYLLQALAASRVQAGRLDLFLGKASAAGDPLRPSRLLLRCADDELPRRVGFLFREAEAERANPPWRRAWMLVPPRVPAPARLAVTALRDWLACPFRSYLSRVLRLRPVDPAKIELDAPDFGNLCHAALEEMGRAQELRNCAEEDTLRDFLLAALDREAVKRLGSRLTLPLVVQLESARQRLRRAAAEQARLRGAGWVIAEVEHGFELEIAGLRVSGKIDRIDRHEQTGAVRVLDYKTSDQPARPREAHLRGMRRDEAAPEFARVRVDGRELVWSDLQLPLYLRALTGDFPGGKMAGYFNLPKASGGAGLELWEDYPAELAESAWHCAEGVVASVRAGRFWPPNEAVRPEQDDFAELFHHGAAESIAWPGEGAP
ncbi:MAG TPA: PD-(D/E)XK nuclease family protein [Opitutaceae bacterium]|nr:PD-(D/E)XK nuclease family protein [Opitutaceae bacterium]